MTMELHNPDMMARDVVITSVVRLNDQEWVVGTRAFSAVLLDGREIDVEPVSAAFGVFSGDPVHSSATYACSLMEKWMVEGTPTTLTTQGASCVWSDGEEMLLLPWGDHG